MGHLDISQGALHDLWHHGLGSDWRADQGWGQAQPLAGEAHERPSILVRTLRQALRLAPGDRRTSQASALMTKRRSSMGRRPVAGNGLEQDAFTGWRKVLCYMGRPGVTKKVKRMANKRDRRAWRNEEW